MKMNSPVFVTRFIQTICLIFIFTEISTAQSTNNTFSSGDKISQKELIDDFRMLVEIIESAHPDPYIYSGGKIAFHKRVHQIISKIPVKGMTQEEFYWLLCPFLASIGDSHTKLGWEPNNNIKELSGIPVRFGVADTSLYVETVFDSSQIHLIGCRLISVENISVIELRKRIKQFYGFQNKYYGITKLAREGYKSGHLLRGYLLEALIPEWEDKINIDVELEKPDKTVINYNFKLPQKYTKPYNANSIVKVPSLKSSHFNYIFTNSSKSTAILSIKSPGFSRESFERDMVRGYNIKEWASEYYEKCNKKPAPEDIDSILNGLPSATETFIELLNQMKQAQTRTLIIDLRAYNGGGFAINHMLLYFLYGKEKLHEIITKSRWVEKLSDSYFELNKMTNIDSINIKSQIDLNKTDYYFDEDLCGWSDDVHKIESYILNDYESKYKTLTTFWEVYNKSRYDQYYKIPNIVVISSDNTFSGGFEMLVSLYFGQATILGTPSGQDVNQFGDTLPFELKYSGLKGRVSHSWFENFSDEVPEGFVLMPNYLMTYDKLVKYNFDPNAEILYALDLFEK